MGFPITASVSVVIKLSGGEMQHTRTEFGGTERILKGKSHVCRVKGQPMGCKHNGRVYGGMNQAGQLVLLGWSHKQTWA